MAESEPGATFYGCILVAGQPLPDGVSLNGSGRLIARGGKAMNALAQHEIFIIIDLNKSRKKHFTGLKKGVDYYFYFYAGNSAGVSQLSEKVELMCG